MIPKELDFERRLFNFNRYLKKLKVDPYYKLDTIAMNFYEKYFDSNLLSNVKIDGDNKEGMIKATNLLILIVLFIAFTF